MIFFCSLFIADIRKEGEFWKALPVNFLQLQEYHLLFLAYKVSIVAGNGSYALNNLGVLTQKGDGNSSAASSLFQQAQNAEAGWEAHWNSGNG